MFSSLTCEGPSHLTTDKQLFDKQLFFSNIVFLIFDINI